jgi:hypothetical protein
MCSRKCEHREHREHREHNYRINEPSKYSESPAMLIKVFTPYIQLCAEIFTKKSKCLREALKKSGSLRLLFTILFPN